MGARRLSQAPVVLRARDLCCAKCCEVIGYELRVQENKSTDT